MLETVVFRNAGTKYVVSTVCSQVGNVNLIMLSFNESAAHNTCGKESQELAALRHSGCSGGFA